MCRKQATFYIQWNTIVEAVIGAEAVELRVLQARRSRPRHTTVITQYLKIP